VDIAQDSLSNIKPSFSLNNLGFDDNAKNLMGNDSGKKHYETENTTVLNSCTRESHTIASTIKKTNYELTSSEILKRDVRRKLDFKVNCDVEYSETSKCTAIKRKNETFESNCGVSKLDWTLENLNSSFLSCGDIKMIEETNKSLISDYSNIIKSTPIMLEVTFLDNKHLHIATNC